MTALRIKKPVATMPIYRIVAPLLAGWLLAGVLAGSECGPGVGACQAQTPLALQNIGQNIGTSDARASGRGGWGMTVQDTLAPGFKNLAGLAGISNVVLQFTAYGERVSSTSADGDRMTFRTYAPNLRAAVPMAGDRLAATAGFQARRSSEYRSQVQDSLVVWDERIDYFELFVREGTQFQTPLGLSARLRDGLSVGFSVNLIRGVQTETLDETFWQTTITDEGEETENVTTSFPYVRSRQEQKDIFSGTSTSYSLLWHAGKVKLGARFTPTHDVEVQRTVSLSSVAARNESGFTMRMPAEWSVGGQLRVKDRWRLGADFDFTQFSHLSGRWEWEQDMQDEWTFSAGLERQRANIRHGGATNWPLRAGFSMRRWGYLVHGHQITERAISIGTGVPLRRGEGHVDVAATYGIIGKESETGSQSSFVRLMVTVTGLERWW